MQPKTIARDTLMIYALTFVGGIFVGVASGLKAISPESTTLLIAASNLVCCTVGFTISAAKSPWQRWKHILLVALCLWPMGFINLFFGVTLGQWFFSIFFILLTMAIGGAISYIFAGSSLSSASNADLAKFENLSNESAEP